MSLKETKKRQIAESDPRADGRSVGEITTCPRCHGAREMPVMGSDNTQACTECFGVGEILQDQSD